MKQLQLKLSSLVDVKSHEINALLLSCLYFYLLLCGYYIIRPIRDEMVIANGVDNIQWLLLLTMFVLLAITPTFGWLTKNYRTRQFLSICTAFFACNLFIFYVFFSFDHRPIWVTRSFFVWVNVFNMFIVSLFWSFMNDIFNQFQAKRLFAFIAAGGTAGALTGPIITNLLVDQFGLSTLLLISSIILSSTIPIILMLSKLPTRNHEPISAQHFNNEALKGSVWGGLKLIIRSRYLLGISAFIILYAFCITFVQITQAHFIESTYNDPIERTKLFSLIDLAVNGLTLLFQLFLTSRIIKWFGFTTTLLIVPIGITLGFALLAMSPLLVIMILIEIFRRSGDYAIMKPVREMLFSVLSREEKYKAKNVIDTLVLRSGNATSAWIYAGIKSLGASAATIASISVVIAALWCWISLWLGNQFQKKSKTNDVNSNDRS